ncbi:MAG: transglutaminase family protein [Cytophagaceae bacterium]
MSEIYLVEYVSENKYEELVAQAIFEYLVFPCADQTQTVLNYSIKPSFPCEPFLRKNAFGFQTIVMRPKEGFKDFTFIFQSKVQKHVFPESSEPELYSLEDQLEIIASKSFFIDNHLYLSRSPLTTLSSKHSKLILKYRKGTGLVNFFDQLNAYIYSILSYEKDLTTVESTANEVIELGKGVCQDYVHLFIAMARANKFPCRYVSGYLNQGNNYVGSAMLHAWAEVFIPGNGWMGYDPANNIRVGSHHIKISHGRDYRDCSPIKGVILSNGANTTSHQVKVEQQ